MRIVIGEGSCGIAAGAQKVRSALEALISDPIGSTGCIGMCYLEPIVDLYEGKELLRRLVRVSDKDADISLPFDICICHSYTLDISTIDGTEQAGSLPKSCLRYRKA